MTILYYTMEIFSWKYGLYSETAPWSFCFNWRIFKHDFNFIVQFSVDRLYDMYQDINCSSKQFRL